MQEKRKYDTLVISNTYDLERLVMYPEKAAVARTYEEIRHLISNGHIVEVRDEYSNVVVDNVEKLDMLYKPADYGLVQEENVNPNEPADVSTRFIRLPNGTILDTEVLMNNNNGVQPNGYNIPQYIQSTPDVLPKAIVNVELNKITPEGNTGEQSKEEISKESEDKTTEEESSEDNNKKNKKEGDGK